ncbi:MAG: AlpA family phage regulatory protein [Paraglaciecola sp.]|uniref:helix-turn-helix transcriptional regulator n=1 Tax=Paraglaciecola sp. TaxID=1920173 RepID=UPI003297100E
MNITDKLIVNRKPEVLKRLGISKTTFHNRINQNLLPPPISLGDRAVGYLQHEIDTVLAAMVAGKSDSDLKMLVAELVTQRQHVA